MLWRYADAPFAEHPKLKAWLHRMDSRQSVAVTRPEGV